MPLAVFCVRRTAINRRTTRKQAKRLLEGGACIEPLNDEFYMRLALQLAGGAAGQTGVNPVVGCVVVKDGRIVGMGAHLKRGEAHAEVHALNMAGTEAAGATVYVTLEPCSHYGRTPPCCDRLIGDNVSRVVVAAPDPNPLVAGQGIERLKAHGIETTGGLMQKESETLNEAYNWHIATGMPFVTLKTALTLDGRIATSTGHSRWITGPSAREAVHTLRHRHAGIMVGVGTVIADNPGLTTRLSVPALHPKRIVVDSALRTPPESQVLNGEAPTIILTTERADPERAKRLAGQAADGNIEIVRCGEGPQVDLALAMRELSRRDIGSILLEGGGKLNGAMLRHRLVNKMMLFYAAKIVGAAGAPSAFDFEGPSLMSEAYSLTNVSIERYGDDWCVTGHPVYENSAEQAERR